MPSLLDRGLPLYDLPTLLGHPPSPDEKLDYASALLSLVGGEKISGVGENPRDLQLLHHYIPGMYVRECFIPANYTLVTKIHKTTHAFVVLEGVAAVASEADGPQEISAPYFGITQAGTRRLIRTFSPVRWITFHPTSLTDPAEIEREIIEEGDNGLADWFFSQISPGREE